MNTNTIVTYIAEIGIILTALFAAFVVYKFILNVLGQTEQKSKELVRNFDLNIQKKGEMNEQQLFLSKNGIMFHFGNYDLKPSQFMILRIFAGMLIALLIYLLSENPLSLIGFAVGFYGLGPFFKLTNKSENEAMMMDIYNTYANIKIQLVSGIYIGDCLEYTYKIVKNERYKDAMKELLLNFSDKTITSSEAIEIFRNRFNSKEIDKLCMMLSSFVEYGMSESYLQDIMFEVQELLEADEIKSRHDIESKTGMITFAFFVLVVALVAFGMAGSMGGVTSFLNF